MVFQSKNAYLVSNDKASSESSKPDRKCCCLNDTDNSAILLVGVVDMVEVQELKDDNDKVGEDGGDGYNSVGNGRFKVTKCSWLQTIRNNSSLNWANREFTFPR